MDIIRATKLAQQAAAYSVRIQGMARQHHISLEEEFDEHDTPKTKYIVAIDDYLPVATCRLYAIDDTHVMLGRIVVMPDYRHQGLGTLVVRSAEAWAKELGFTHAVLESRVEKVAFYEKMGYRSDWSQQTDGTFHCVRMEKPL
ncbi:MAG: GNAT family N-acetyltransferase [Bacteroidaceae bacterium]|nr:GNAT family N-acetyltransferase [Bacteroidaceae bacterium]